MAIKYITSFSCLFGLDSPRTSLKRTRFYSRWLFFLNEVLNGVTCNLSLSWYLFPNELVRSEVMTEVKDNTYKDLFPVSSGATLTTSSEDASKRGGKPCTLAFSISQ